jgi:hypothetical protein
MTRQSSRMVLVATAIAMLATSMPANAGGYPSGHGYGYSQPDRHHSGGYGNSGHYLPPQGGWYGHDHGRPQYPGHGRRGICEPHEAVEKAHDFGLRRVGIERVTRHEIVVSGRQYGHRALLVFDRFSRHCRVIATRGL